MQHGGSHIGWEGEGSTVAFDFLFHAGLDEIGCDFVLFDEFAHGDKVFGVESLHLISLKPTDQYQSLIMNE